MKRELPGSDGQTRPYEYVVHDGAGVILPILDDGRVVLIRNHRVAVAQDLLELPAGCVEPPESPLECARRELAEETGYQAGRLEPLLSFYSTPGMCSELMHVFLATELKPGPTRLEPGEDILVEPMEYADALHAISAGRIIDAKTIVALLYYERFGRREGKHS
ncbi:MAG: NUDIX hydrolase [Planctomycetes bacterium]|nr:NUDIX hydrolase [Planctomycetota bacterium]